MNEWSPGGNYSRPGTPNQNVRSLRCQQDESMKGTKPLVGNMRVHDNRSRNFQQHSMEDVSKGLSSTVNKKGGGMGTSDPRFKRVVPLGVQNDACVGTEVKTVKPSLVPEDKEAPASKFPIWNAPEFKPNKSWVDCIKNSDESKLKPKESSGPDCENSTAEGDSNVNNHPQTSLRSVDSLTFSPEITVKSVYEETLSECTMNTRNTSLVSGELPQEYSGTLSTLRVPSAAKFKNIENWIEDQGVKPERKHSVITVIGQMQAPDTLSSALKEIDKRRKLVKELDRYAVCKKIIETDKDKEITELIEKISSLNNNESVLFGGSNDSLNTISNSTKEGESKKQSGASDDETPLNKHNDLNDYAVKVVRRSSGKKRLTKNQPGINCPLKVRSLTENCSLLTNLVTALTFIFLFITPGKLPMLVRILPYRRVFCILIILSGILSWFAFFSIQKGTYVSFDLFNSKPKPLTWYERLCNWIWEFFRPSNNYHRTTQWPSY